MKEQSRKQFAFVAPCIVAVFSAIGLNDVSLRGTVRQTDQRVAAHIGTEVRTPLGRLAVNGRTDVHYACDRSFEGSVSYSRVVRALAAIRHVTLVTRIEGTLDASTAFDCTTAGDSLVGTFAIKDSVLTGTVRYGNATTQVRGAVTRIAQAYDIALAAAADTTRALAHVILK